MNTKRLVWTSLLVLALMIVPGAFAQDTTAGFQGTVKDASGAVIANAKIEVSSQMLLGTRTINTDSAGNYRFAALPAGEYTVSVTAPGFRTSRSTGLVLDAGRQPTIDFKMEVGAVAETVEVSSAAPIVDVTQSKVATTIEASVIRDLPKGRSFQSLIPFASGARQEPLQSGGNGTRGVSGFQIDGASDSENVFMVDGVNITNIQNGGIAKSFPTDFVEEVQIKTSSYEAEYGGALGGVVNAVPKRGSNDWHGSFVTYYQNQGMNANDSDRGLRIDPALAARNTNFSGTCVAAGTCRLDGTPQYYYSKPDSRSIVEPGYTVGGPLLKDKLWIYSAYIPSIDTTRRTTNFTGLNPGPRTLTSTTTTQNAVNRLDYAPLNSLRLFSSWTYQYFRQTGALGGADSPFAQRNTGASTDPNTIRSDSGSVNPQSTFTYGADWTPTSKLVVSARYGYLFQNTEARGKPTGLRYSYANTLATSSVDVAGNAFPSSAPFNTSGFANIPSNLATAYDAYKRDALNLDVSYFAHFWGSHNLKGGFFYQRQSNDVLSTFNGGAVAITWGTNYTPVTSSTACDAVIAANKTAYGAGATGCEGKYGYFTVGTGVVNTGGDQQTAKALYFQDSWQVAGVKGLTLNLGVRFDNEFQPAYDPTRFPSVSFGWGDKIAPRLGGAYDLLHNGKVKVYASYGKFFDIMKMGLARGSFGSDYWHNCVYALDDLDYTKITPTYPIGGGCPASGPAPGVTTGRFIENVDFRATKADPRDPAIAPDMKPMLQHEFVTGVDVQLGKSWGLETRYARKRLDRTIEDMAITDNLGFYIGNPGSTIADVLHRPTSIPCITTPGFSCTPDAAGNYLNNTPFCAECPKVQGAVRNYDGLDIRLIRRAGGKWFGGVSYSYSALRGNYAGLTNSDPTDGTSGRHAPNNGRAFDIPVMTYDPSGKPQYGPLATDRPHTAKLFGTFSQKWSLFGHNMGETTLGGFQTAYQGTPINTCLPVVGSSSSCQYAEGRGGFVSLTRAANGSIVAGTIDHDARTAPLFQTDITITHRIKVTENQAVSIEFNVLNVLNQRAATAYYEFAIPTGQISPNRPARFAGDPGIDWGKVMNGYNYIDALNGTGAFAGTVAGSSTVVQAPLTLASQYGLPNQFQTARNVRLALHYTF